MTDKKYIVALDQGTTSSRAVVMDHDANIVSVSQREFEQIYPKPGWVEHDPMEIWASQSSTLVEVLAKADISSDEIAAIGITNQRETAIVWERETGKPIYNAIVWQCRRTADICEKLKRDGMEEYVRSATGLVVDPYFSGTKVKWILDHVEGSRERAKRGELLFGTVDTWLIWKMTQDASTLPTTPTPRAPCCSTSTIWTGMTKCWTRWISRVPCCRRCESPLKCTARPTSAVKAAPVFRLPGSPGTSRRRCLASCA